SLPRFKSLRHSRTEVKSTGPHPSPIRGTVEDAPSVYEDWLSGRTGSGRSTQNRSIGCSVAGDACEPRFNHPFSADMPKVLHIEDDPANRLLVRKLLTPAGFEVIDAVDGMDGIQKAVSDPPDLVLVDIAIPGLDGYEVTLRLRAEPRLAEVPIVAITAEGNRDTSLAVGANGFIEKPIDARTFAHTIHGYLGGQSEQSGHIEESLRKQSQRIVGHLEEKVSELSLANQRLLELDQARKEFYRNVSHE